MGRGGSDLEVPAVRVPLPMAPWHGDNGLVEASELRAVRVAFAAVALLAGAGTGSVAESDDASVALERARRARLAGDLEAAADGLLRFLRDRSDLTPEAGSALHKELGEILLQQGRASTAADHFESALRARPGQAAVHYQAGIARRSAGDDAGAADHLSRAVELGFRVATVHVHLAGALLGSGRFSAGLTASRALLDSSPESAPILMQLGRQLFTHLFYADAQSAFEAAVALDPESYEARFFLALTNHLQRRHEEASELLSTLSREVALAEPAVLLAAALAGLDRLDQAEALLIETIGAYPKSPHAHLNLALVLLERGSLDEAEERLETLLALQAAESPKVFYEIRRNSCPDVVETLSGPSALVERDPDRADAFFGLAQTLAARHHHGSAVEALRLARRYEGNSSRTLRALGRSCLHLDPHAPSPVEILREFLRLRPDSGYGHHLLGRAHLRQGRADAAIRAHTAAVGAAPGESDFRTELARAYLAEGSAESIGAAMREFREAASLDPANAIARYELGKLLLQESRLEEALSLLEEAIRVAPEFHNAHYALAQAHLRRGERERARELLDLFGKKRAATEARGGAATGFASDR